MTYRIEGFGKEFPNGYVLERDTAIDAIEAFHAVADLCGDAQVFRDGRSVMLSDLREAAEKERLTAPGKTV